MEINVCSPPLGPCARRPGARLRNAYIGMRAPPLRAARGASGPAPVVASDAHSQARLQAMFDWLNSPLFARAASTEAPSQLIGGRQTLQKREQPSRSPAAQHRGNAKAGTSDAARMAAVGAPAPSARPSHPAARALASLRGAITARTHAVWSTAPAAVPTTPLAAQGWGALAISAALVGSWVRAALASWWAFDAVQRLSGQRIAGEAALAQDGTSWAHAARASLASASAAATRAAMTLLSALFGVGPAVAAVAAARGRDAASRERWMVESPSSPEAPLAPPAPAGISPVELSRLRDRLRSEEARVQKLVSQLAAERDVSNRLRDRLGEERSRHLEERRLVLQNSPSRVEFDMQAETIASLQADLARANALIKSLPSKGQWQDALLQIDKLKEELTSLKAELVRTKNAREQAEQALQAAKRSAQADLADVKTRLGREVEARAEREQQVSAMEATHRQETARLQDAVTQLEAQLADARATGTDATRLQAAVADLESRLQASEERARQEALQLRSAATALEEQLREARAGDEGEVQRMGEVIRELEAQVKGSQEASRAEVAGLQQLVATLEAEGREARASFEARMGEVEAAYVRQIAELEERARGLEADLREARAGKDAGQERGAEMEARARELEQQLTQLQALRQDDVQSSEASGAASAAAIADLKSQIAALEQMAEEANALHAEEMEQLRAHYESTLDDAAIAKEEMEVEMELASSRWEVEKARLETQMATMKSQLEKAKAEHAAETTRMNTKLMEVMKAVSEAAAEKEELEGLALSLNTQVKELRESLKAMKVTRSNGNGSRPLSPGTVFPISDTPMPMPGPPAPAPVVVAAKRVEELAQTRTGRTTPAEAEAELDAGGSAVPLPTQTAPRAPSETVRRGVSDEEESLTEGEETPGFDPEDVPLGWVREKVVQASAPGLVMRMAGVMAPHVEKEGRGEDAFFVAARGRGAIGVADGVGGWNQEGVNPGNFSRMLAQTARGIIEKGPEKGSDLRVVMDAAHRATDIPGGATFVMAQLVAPSGGDADASATLQGLNLGDSAFMVFRNGRRVFESPTQSHGFNMPYQFTQVSMYPESDTADRAEAMTFEVREGDVVVAGSDGLFDNLWHYEIGDEIVAHVRRATGVANYGPDPGSRTPKRPTSPLGTVGDSLGLGSLFGTRGSYEDRETTESESEEEVEGPVVDLSSVDPEPLAERLVDLAQKYAYDEGHYSPILDRAKEEGQLPWQMYLRPTMGGGKMDDCTAVVAMIVRNGPRKA